MNRIAGSSRRNKTMPGPMRTPALSYLLVLGRSAGDEKTEVAPGSLARAITGLAGKGAPPSGAWLSARWRGLVPMRSVGSTRWPASRDDRHALAAGGRILA